MASGLPPTVRARIQRQRETRAAAAAISVVAQLEGAIASLEAAITTLTDEAVDEAPQ